MAHRERHILEQAVHAVPEQAAKADALVDEAIEVGHGRSDPLVVHANMLRLELLKVKAELEDFSGNCSKCGLGVHGVSGLGITPGHWSHAEPAPQGEPEPRPDSRGAGPKMGPSCSRPTTRLEPGGHKPSRLPFA